MYASKEGASPQTFLQTPFRAPTGSSAALWNAQGKYFPLYKQKCIETLACIIAGVAFKGNTFGAAEARQTLDTNFVGTQHVCEAIAPLMTSGGRIVNICSMAGKQRIIKSQQLLQEFNVGHLDLP